MALRTTSRRTDPLRTLRVLLIGAVGLQLLWLPGEAQSRLSRLAQLTSGFRITLAYSPAVPVQGQPVSFRGEATEAVQFWLWDFGDGVTSTRQNEVHTFRRAGFFRVTLTATTGTGSKKTVRTFAVLPDSLSASFVYSPTSPGVGQTVSFADTTPGETKSWLWDFGDGTTSTVKNPSHAFTKAGYYTVSLACTGGSGTNRVSRTITVASMSILTASFTYSPAAPAAGQSVQFTDTSTGDPTAWFWKFGDGSTSSQRHPSHVYAAAGSYSVSLTSANASGSKSVSRTVVVTGTTPTVSFTYTPAYPDVGQVVQFTDLSTGEANAWSWDFNDGTTSAERNPGHAFSSAGTFNVTLSVSGPSGTQSHSRRVLVGSGNVTAGTYWVSPTGTATWPDSRSDSPLAGSACCSLRTANANAAAGDVICLRGGTYTVSLAPVRSGTKENRIVFQAYGGEIPRFTVDEAGGRWAVKLQGVSYIKVEGIVSSNSGAFFFIGYGACSNEIAHCEFDRSSADYQLGYITDWNSARNAKAKTRDNWLHHNSFSRYGKIDYLTGEDLGTIRISSNYDDTTSHNTFEDNVFFYGGHDCIDIGGQFNVVRNNVFHNEGAYFKDLTKRFDNVPASGYFGNRNILLSNSGENPGTAYHTLIEGNRIGYAGTPPDDDGSTGIENAGCHTIVRYNDIYGNGGMGYYSKMQPEGGQRTNLKSGSWGRVYHNTIYHGGYGDASIYGDQFKHGVCIWSYTAYDDWPTNVVVKNNIVFDNFQEWRVGSANILPQVTYANNFNSDPVFANPDMTDKFSLVLPDLRLSDGSPCIDAGAPLTRAKGSGTAGLTLVVEDAFLFQDGTWGSALTHGVTHFPDWIAVGTVANAVRIAAVDYAAKTVTLASPMTWTDGDRIWLYSDSGGRLVLKGSAPDIGAHEVER